MDLGSALMYSPCAILMRQHWKTVAFAKEVLLWMDGLTFFYNFNSLCYIDVMKLEEDVEL